MTIDLYEVIAGNPALMIFLTIGVGYLFGRLKIGSVEIGPTTGVLLTGLLMGHLGFQSPELSGQVGFTLFIFCVGLQAGPQFFSAFAEDGRRYVVLALLVAAIGVTLSLVLSSLVGLDYGMAPGVLAGSLTSTPTLAGAQDAVRSGAAILPEGMSAKQALENITVGYALTYVFGTVGLIAFVNLLPRMLRVDLAGEAKRLAREKGIREGHGEEGERGGSLPLLRAYRISDERFVGRSVRDQLGVRAARVVVLKIKRDGKIIEHTPDTVLQMGDLVSILADLEHHQLADDALGTEVLDPELIDFRIDSQEIVVTNGDMIGVPLAKLDFPSRFGCFATSISRAQIDLVPLDARTSLQRGDVIRVAGERSRIAELARSLGYVEREADTTDLVTLSLGVAAGLLLGLFAVKFGEVSIGLGSAGGLLLVGILIGFLRSLHPTFGRVPPAATNVLMDLGLMFFMAGVGIQAGAGVVSALSSVGLEVIAGGALVTLVPPLVGYFVGRQFMGMNPALLLGSITGAMTSTPSLGIVQQVAKSSLPALGYAGTYTFANVFLTFAGSAMMRL
jgi:putative transport protein